jgi:hypothetical protein
VKEGTEGWERRESGCSLGICLGIDAFDVDFLGC